MSDVPHITVVGLGNAGCRMVDSLIVSPHVLNRDGAALVAVGTDFRLLRKLNVKVRVHMGKRRAHGHGTGGNAELGRSCAEDDRETLAQLFTQGGMVFVMVALGGGTGSGAAPVLLDCARRAGAVVYCVATMPPEYEGPQHLRNAEKAVGEIARNCDALVLVPLGALCEHVGGRNVAETLAKANRLLASATSSLWRLVTHPGYIGLDFADLREFARRSTGIIRLGFGDATGKNKAADALLMLTESPLMEKGRLMEEARALLVSIRGGPDLTVQEVGEIMKGIKARAAHAARIYMGTVIEDEYRNRIMVTMLCSPGWNEQETTVDKEVPCASDTSNRQQACSGTSRAELQQTLRFETMNRGRFKDDAPTVVDGEDLDIPTFIRRQVDIER
ncbi:MAG: cell division FtsZ family protein [Kiritimatiellae bacterium]|nr:cell division FtsZ family protein [Kiritimatiellia bacterium]